jgi:hypothetical protein
LSDTIEIINSRLPISVRAYFVPALENSVLWVNDTVKRSTYLNGHKLVAKAAIGYLRNVAAQVAIKGVMQYHLPEIDSREMSNTNHSYYYYDFTNDNFTLTISQVGWANCMPKEALYRNALMNRAEPILFSEEIGEEVIPYLLMTFNVEGDKLASAKLGIPVDLNGKSKWLGNQCIDLFKEPHFTPSQLPTEVIETPKVEFLNTIMDVSRDEQ